MRERRLNDDELTDGLEHLDNWAGDTAGISRTIEAASFRAAIHLVSEVAALAEEMDHHPDIDIRWRRVHFALVTHDSGGVTSLDLTLAARIDELARR